MKVPKVPRVVILEQYDADDGEDVEHEHEDDSDVADRGHAHYQGRDDDLQLRESLDELQDSQEAEHAEHGYHTAP